MERKKKLLNGAIAFVAAVLVCLLMEQNRNSRFPAPELTGVRDFYVAVGSHVDYGQRVTAWDEIEGDLTAEIVVDASEVLLDQLGEYLLVYQVENSHGRKTKAESRVFVYPEKELQELINTHRISPRDKYIAGAYNAYDGGCYRENKVEAVLAMMEPAFVRIAAEGVGHGSGFLMEITEGAVYILTNYHVTCPMPEPVIYFHDGTSAPGTVIAEDEVKDIALIEVDRGQLSEDFVESLKTVHIEREDWERSGNNGSWVAIRCIQENGEVWREARGKLLTKEGSNWEFPHTLVEYTLPNFAGASGSAVLDNRGNLIAMVLGISKDKSGYRYWGVRLPDLLEFYEEATGRTVDYRAYYR